MEGNAGFKDSRVWSKYQKVYSIYVWLLELESRGLTAAHGHELWK